MDSGGGYGQSRRYSAYQPHPANSQSRAGPPPLPPRQLQPGVPPPLPPRAPSPLPPPPPPLIPGYQPPPSSKPSAPSENVDHLLDDLLESVSRLSTATGNAAKPQHPSVLQVPNYAVPPARSRGDSRGEIKEYWKGYGEQQQVQYAGQPSNQVSPPATRDVYKEYLQSYGERQNAYQGVESPSPPPPPPPPSIRPDYMYTQQPGGTQQERYQPFIATPPPPPPPPSTRPIYQTPSQSYVARQLEHSALNSSPSPVPPQIAELASPTSQLEPQSDCSQPLKDMPQSTLLSAPHPAIYTAIAASSQNSVQTPSANKAPVRFRPATVEDELPSVAPEQAFIERGGELFSAAKPTAASKEVNIQVVAEREPQPYAVQPMNRETRVTREMREGAELERKQTKNPWDKFLHTSPDVAVKITDLIRPPTGSRDVIRGCPYPDACRYAVRWYWMESIPEFLVCSHCFENSIWKTRFKDNFKSAIVTYGEERRCHFATPRMKAIWEKTISSNNLESAEIYMKHRAAIPACHGANGVNGTVSTKWFQMKNGEVEGFISCEACYEDIILATSFSNYFQLHKANQPADVVWSCDTALRYISRTILKDSQSNNWQKFINSAARRLKAQACAPYDSVQATSTAWYHCKWPLSNFIICEACFLDQISNSVMERYFEQRLSSLVPKEEKWMCSMGFLGMKVSWDVAFYDDNFRLWFENARILTENKVCSGRLETFKRWHTLKGKSENFDLCPSCYSCFIESLGFASHFEVAVYPSDTQRACDFHPTMLRFPKYMDKLAEAVFVNDFSVVEDAIATWAIVPQCPGSNKVKDRRWWGTDNFLACNECYISVIKGSVLEPSLKYVNATADNARRCDLWSPRMRGLWAIACANNDIASFNTFAHHRSEVYANTIMVAQNMLTQAKMRLFEQQRLNAMSSFYSNMNMMASTANGINYTGIPQTTYSYSAVGVPGSYATSYGVDGARYGQQAQAIAFSGGGETATIARLEAMWKEVE